MTTLWCEVTSSLRSKLASEDECLDDTMPFTCTDVVQSLENKKAPTPKFCKGKGKDHGVTMTLEEHDGNEESASLSRVNETVTTETLQKYEILLCLRPVQITSTGKVR